jgi:hypothetical protein
MMLWVLEFLDENTKHTNSVCRIFLTRVSISNPWLGKQYMKRKKQYMQLVQVFKHGMVPQTMVAVFGFVHELCYHLTCVYKMPLAWQIAKCHHQRNRIEDTITLLWQAWIEQCQWQNLYSSGTTLLHDARSSKWVDLLIAQTSTFTQLTAPKLRLRNWNFDVVQNC